MLEPMAISQRSYRRSMLAAYPLIALVVLGLTIWSAAIIWSFPYDGLYWDEGGRVVEVMDDGPALAVGVRAGDQILRVHGEPTTRITPYLHMRPGQQVVIDLLQAGQPRQLTLTLAEQPLSTRLLMLEPLLIGMVFWGVGLVVWGLHPRESAAQIFFLLCQVVAGVLATGILTTIRWPLSTPAFNLLLVLVGPLTLHFFASFPTPALPAARRVLALAYVIAAALCVITIFYAPTSLRQAAPTWLWLGRRAYTVLTTLAGLGFMLLQRPNAPLHVLRQRRLLMACMLLSITPALLLSFLPELLQGAPLVKYQWTFLTLILLPLAYGYAVSKGELGRIDLILNRILVYGTLSVILLSGYLLLFIKFFRSSVGQAGEEQDYSLLAGLILVGVVLLYGPLQRRLQLLVDRHVYGGWYNYRMLVRRASAELSRTSTLAELGDGLLTIMRTMRFDSAALLWPQARELRARAAFGYEDELLAQLTPSTSGQLLGQLHSEAGLRSPAQLRALLDESQLSAAEQALLSSPRVRLLLPLISRQALRGLLILGERPSDNWLDREDVDILTTLADQAATAADNVLLLETLRRRLAEVEEMHNDLLETRQRLAESREAERLRLAQELHDGPVQELYGVRFQLEHLHRSLQDPLGQQGLGDIQSLLHDVTASLRTFCRELRPPTLDPFGLEGAIRSYCEALQQKHPQLTIDVDLMPDGQLLPEWVRLSLFRICQELLNNIVRHARARHASIRLAYDDDQLTLEIADSGVGFAVPARWIDLARQGHLGLLGAAERAESIGGTLTVQSEPGAGTYVCVTGPYRFGHDKQSKQTGAPYGEVAASDGQQRDPRGDRGRPPGGEDGHSHAAGA